MGQPFLGQPGSLSILAGAQKGISEEDARILRGLRAGIEEAYEELLRRYEQPVFGIVYRLVGNEAEACDVVQEVFIKIFRGVASFREQSSLRTWIYRIAVNEAHNRRRWFVRHCRHEVSIEGDGEDRKRGIDSAPDPARSPYDQVVDSESQALIEQALSRLRPIFRAAVVLRDVENLSYEEIAEILQVSLGTVKSRLVRGREALRRELTQRLDPGFAEAYG
jgi:RNA polymerase sigma-70 factor (ECF subfamily)